MAKITFWSAGENDGCSFYRCQEPARVLAAGGHETLSGKQIGLGTLMSSDVVVVARATEADTLGWVEKLKSLRQGPKIVYELDDDLLSVPAHFPPGIHGPLTDKLRRSRILRFMELADVVTVTTDALADRVCEEAGWPLELSKSAWNGRVRVVPNWVPERLVRTELPPRPEDHDPFSGFYRYVVGWSGSATHRVDFEQCIVPLRRLLRSRNDVMVTIFGPDYARRLRTAAQEDTQVDNVAWVEGVEAAVRSLEHLDVGLAPLEPNTFNLSKSDLKLKEYAARGVAAIAVDYGPYASGAPGTVPPGVRLRDGHADTWGQALEFVLDNPDALEQARTYALAWAQANTLENHAGQWEDALLG